MNGCNPLLEWMHMTDTNGVNLACYMPVYESGILNTISMVVGLLINIVVMIGMFVAGIALFLVRILTDENLIIGYLGDIVQFVLNTLHSIIPPFALVSLAFGVVMLRVTAPGGGENGSRFFEWLIPSANIREKASSTIPGFMRGYGSKYYSGREPFRSFTQALVQAGMIAAIIYILSLNPVYLLVGAINAVAGIGSNLVKGGDSGMEYATGMIENLIGIVNFSNGDDFAAATGECRQRWIAAMTTSDTGALEACLGGSLPNAGAVELILSFLFLVVLLALAYYLMEMFFRGSLFLTIVIWDFVLLPYKLGWEMFKPDFTSGSKKWLDIIEETIFDFFLYLFYFLLVVFLMTSGPTLVVYLVSAGGEMHAILQYLIITLILYFGGKNAYRIGPSAEISDTRLSSWSDLFSNVMYRDEVTNNYQINWKQLGNNFKETRPATFARAVWGDETTMQDIRDLDAEKSTQVRKTISSAAGLDLKAGEPVPALYQDMWDNVDSRIENLPNLIASTNALYNAGKITEKERDARIEKLQDREDTLHKIKKAKRDYVKETAGAIPSDEKVVPERLKGVLKKDTATQKEIDKAEALSRASFVAEYLKGKGAPVTAEQILAWDNVEEDLDDVENRLDQLQERKDIMTAEDYSKRFDDLYGQREALQKVLRGKNTFAAVEATFDTLIKDPDDPGKWITQKQLDARRAQQSVLDTLGFSNDDFYNWQERDEIIPNLEADIQALKYKAHAKTMKKADADKKIAELEAQRDVIKNLDYHFKGIAQEGGLHWVEDPDNEGEKITSYALKERNKKREEAEAKKAEAKKAEAKQAEAKNNPDTKETTKKNTKPSEHDTTEDKKRAALLDELFRISKEQSEKMQMRDTAPTDEKRDELTREIEDLEHQHKIKTENLAKFEKLLSEGQVIGVNAPTYDPKDPLSKDPGTYVPKEDPDGRPTNESVVLTETEKANIAAQKNVYEAVKPALDPIHKAMLVAKQQRQHAPADIVEALNESLQAARALQSAGGESQASQEYLSEIEGIQNKVYNSSEGNNDQAVRQAILQAATALNTASESFVQNLAHERGRSASEARAGEILEQFQQEGVRVKLPTGPQLVKLDEPSLRAMSPTFLDGLNKKISVSLDDETMKKLEDMRPSVNLVGNLDFESSQITRDIYEVGEAAVTDESVVKGPSRLLLNPFAPLTHTKPRNLRRLAKDQQSRIETEGGFGTTLPIMDTGAVALSPDGQEANKILIVKDLSSIKPTVNLKPHILSKDL